jgi:hypothetical protein
MNNATRQYHPEFVGQALIYLIMMLGYLGGLLLGEGGLFIALIFQFFVGVFQVLSGFVHTVAYRSSIHGKYLLGVLAYFSTLGGGIWLSNVLSFYSSTQTFLGIIMLAIVPVAIATWYLNMLTWYYGGKYPTINNKEQEVAMDILDDIRV